MKHWPRSWKVRLILAANPDWDDLTTNLSDMKGAKRPAMTGYFRRHARPCAGIQEAAKCVIGGSWIARDDPDTDIPIGRHP